jgi:hypothetical protein
LTLPILDQKGFVPGHNFSSCDQDFGVIEKGKHFYPEIYVLSQWIEII